MRQARRLRQTMQQAQVFADVFRRSLSLLWRAAPRESSFMLFSILLQSAIPAVNVWVNKQVVDAVMQPAAIGAGFLTIGGLVAVWISSLLIDSLLNPWNFAVQGNLNEKLTAHVNLMLLEKANKLPELTPFEDSKFYDELRLLRDEASFRPLNLLELLRLDGRELFTTLSMLVLLLPLGWWLPLLILLATLPQVFVSFRLQEKAWEIVSGKSPQARRMEYCASLALTDTYAKEVRLFGLGPFLIDQYRAAFTDMHRGMRQFRYQEARWSTGLSILSAAGTAIAFYWVVRQAFSGELSPGSVLLFVQALAFIQQGLSRLIFGTVELYETLLYMQRLFQFMARRSTLTLSAVTHSVPDSLQTGIRFEQVSFAYPDGRVALTDLSFELFPGETVALVGENGAGKTTIVKLLTRLYEPTEGRICIDGIDLRELDLDQWRQQIAVVFQDFGRYAFTLGENIALGNLDALTDLASQTRAADQAGLAELIERLPNRLQTRLGKQFDGTELSGGQWQKVAVARAFVREAAQLLILDEPTAALDPRSESELYAQFTQLIQQSAGCTGQIASGQIASGQIASGQAHPKTTLLITHRLASVRMADRILVLKQGRLIEQGSHADLLRQQGEYATLWAIQAKQYS